MIIVEKSGRITGIYAGNWEIDDDNLIVDKQVILYPVSAFGVHEVPDQDLSSLYVDDEVQGKIIQGTWPDDIPQLYTDAELLAREYLRTDQDTGKAIDRAVQPFAGIEEQIGILRDQLVHVINTLGLEPTADFARLNEIAVKAVEEGAAKKAAL